MIQFKIPKSVLVRSTGPLGYLDHRLNTPYKKSCRRSPATVILPAWHLQHPMLTYQRWQHPRWLVYLLGSMQPSSPFLPFQQDSPCRNNSRGLTQSANMEVTIGYLSVWIWLYWLRNCWMKSNPFVVVGQSPFGEHEGSGANKMKTVKVSVRCFCCPTCFLVAFTMAHVDVNEQGIMYRLVGKIWNRLNLKAQNKHHEKSEAPAPAYFPIGNVIALADDEKDDGSQSVIARFSRYVLDSGVLLLGIDNAALLEAFLSEATACSAMPKFVNGDDATFVLEMQSPLRPPGIEEDGDLEAMFVASDVTFAVSQEFRPPFSMQCPQRPK